MKRLRTLFVTGTLLVAGAGTLVAQEASLHGYLRHQLGATVSDAAIVRNTVTAEVELGYRGTDVDLLVNPSFEAAPGVISSITVTPEHYRQSLAGVDTVVVGIDLSAQVMHQYVRDYEEALDQDEHVWIATFRARRFFLQERLVADVFSYVGFDAPDALVKTGLTWQPVDALAFHSEANLFFGDDGQFGTYDANDLVVVSARYSY